jgi:hypothetical protein
MWWVPRVIDKGYICLYVYYEFSVRKLVKQIPTHQECEINVPSGTFDKKECEINQTLLGEELFDEPDAGISLLFLLR